MFHALKPKLVLMDVSMPEMNGYQAAAAIRASETPGAPRTPIIGVTAHALKGDRERCIESGMDDYIPKPVSPEKLGAKIATWLGQTVELTRRA
jgi:CheY-like chemotaxis protein